MVNEAVRAGYEPVRREAVRLLRMMIENVAGVRPMPDGTTLFVVELDDAKLDRLAEWGASIEDMEPDADFEPDGRELPALRLDLPEVFPASRLIPSPVADLLSLPQALPPHLGELTERV